MSTWTEQSDAVYRVVQAWSDASDAYKGTVSQLAQEYRANFGDFSLRELRELLDGHGKAGGESTDREYTKSFMRALPVPSNERDPMLHPLLNFGVRKQDSQLDLCLRVAVYYELDKRLMADGWRYEMADSNDVGKPHHHHFPHVQQISGWTPFRQDSIGFHVEFLAESDGHTGLDARGMSESRPAIPLACQSPAGIVGAAMASLYGARRTAEILETYTNKPASLTSELSSGLGWAAW